MRDAMNDDLDLAAAYTSGRLPGPLRLLIDTQAAIEPGARADVHLSDAIGGACLEATAPAAMAPNALTRALAAIDEDARADHRRHRSAARAAGAAVQELLDLPEPLRSRALAAAEAGGWRFASPGIKSMPIEEDGPVRAELLRIDPGCGAPNHGHAGAEFTLVLAGSFSDGARTYRRGDLCVAGPHDRHRPINKMDTVCLALAVTDAPLEFTGALGLLQRVFRVH